MVEHCASVPTILMGESQEQIASDMDTVSFRQPLGVCAGITPFNFPAMIPLWMFPLAATCGNTCVALARAGWWCCVCAVCITCLTAPTTLRRHDCIPAATHPQLRAEAV